MLDRARVIAMLVMRPRRGALVGLVVPLLASLLAAGTTSADHTTNSRQPPHSLQGEEAIAHLRNEGTYDSLVAAVTQARYATPRLGSESQPVWEEVARVTGEPNAFDQAGFSVAISGDTVVVGSFHEQFSHGAGFDTNGKAFVFVRKSVVQPGEFPWEYQATLEPPPSTPGIHGSQTTQYGKAVAVSGDIAIVGDSVGSFDFTWFGVGAAYIWVRNGTAWTVEKRIEQSGPSPGHTDFGYAVAISGETAIVGAPSYGPFVHNFKQGAAYVFTRDGGAWNQQTTLEPDDGAREDQFGFSVAISGDRVIVGAPYHDVLTPGGASEDQGQAYAFVRTAGVWSAPWHLIGSTGLPFDHFGISVGISGPTAVVGAYGPDDPPAIGVAYVFQYNGSTWPEQQILTSADSQPPDRFGRSVAIANDTIIVGAPFADIDKGQTITPRQGAAYVFHREGAFWEPQEKLSASDGESNDAFGFAVAISGSGLVVGAPGHDRPGIANQGQAAIFHRIDSDGDALPDEWEENGVTIEGEFIDLPAMGANPKHKDIFVHVDWMAPDPSGTHFEPDPRAIRTVIDSFAVAPVDNPDGRPGIDLHVDFGPLSIMKYVTGASETWGALSRAGEVPFEEFFDSEVDPSAESFKAAFVPVKSHHFAPAKRSAVFHYALYCKEVDLEKPGGRGSQPGVDFVVVQSATFPQSFQSSIFMHELGHNLGLGHGGSDDVNFKPNYISIMNYRFKLIGTLIDDGRQRSIDYSRRTLPTLDETGLDEFVGISDPDGHLTTWNKLTRPLDASNKCVSNFNFYYRLFYPTAALDWDCDGVKTVFSVTADLNGDGMCIYPGPDDELDSSPGGDDVVIGPFIAAGPNRTCETTKTGDDDEKQKPGFVQPPLLTGFDDWANPPTGLVYRGDGTIGNTAGANGTERTRVVSEPGTLPAEASLEEIMAEVPPALLDEASMAPLDVVSFAPPTGAAPLQVMFDGASSTAVGGTIATWEWDFGDGATGSGATTAHTYTVAGAYFATLTVTDSAGHVNLVPLLQRVVVTEGTVATPTPTPTRTVTPPPAGSTPTRTVTPVITATALTPTPSVTVPPIGTPTPHPTHTPPLGIGDVDPSFDATVASVYGKYVDAVVTQPDHKIIVGGEFASFAGCARRNIARVNADGSCDRTFDPGLALTAVHENQIPGAPQTAASTHRIDLVVKSLALQTDGKVLVGLLGYDGFQNGVLAHDRIIVRLNSNGTIDSSFNAVGVSVGFGSPQSVNTIVIQGDGRILIGGAFLYNNGKIRFGEPYLDGAIARLHNDGSVDSSFVVPDGTSLVGFGGPNGPVYAIALQTDGRVIIGGGFSDVGLAQRYGIARLNGDGSFDAGYNALIPATGGYASGFGFVTRVEALALLPDGKVLVGGGLSSTNGNPSNSAAVARLNADGSRDTGFVDWRQHGVRTLVRQPDGKILIGGDFRITDPVVRNSIARLDADGGVDLTFDTPGMTGGVHQFNGMNNDVSAIALQSDGQIVVVGRYDNFNHEPAENILQLATNGSRDPEFDSNGAGTSVQVYALVRQPDGKLLVGFQPNAINRSTRLNAARRGGLGRLNADGSTDATFISPFDANATVFGIVLQPDGKVLVGGSFRLIGSEQTMEFARLNADGTLDAGFALPGPDVHLGNNTGFAVQADGKILAYEANSFGQGLLVRLNANGSRDDTFAFPTYPVERIVVQPDGKILLSSQFARLQRLNADGSVDATFDPGTGPDYTVSSIILQPDGKILIGGFFFTYNGTPRPQMARINADGSLDTGFIPANPYPGREVRALALQLDGKVFGGTSFGDSVLDRNPRVFRLDPDGSFDASFPQDGTGFGNISSSATRIHTLLLLPDESLIVGGQFDVADDAARLALARLLGATPTVPAASLDHFLFYKVKPTKGAPKFAPLGPVTLADTVTTTDVDVRKLAALGLPVDANGRGVSDAQTHLVAYGLKMRKAGPKFRPRADVAVQNPCGELVVTVKKPEHLLVAAHLDLAGPVSPPVADTHEVADFRCYKVKVQKKRSDGTPTARLPKGVQLDAVDQFQSRRYELKKLTRLCYPVGESGAPVVLNTGEPIAFTPAALRHETVHLACYQAKPAKKLIAQDGCGPRDPKDKGTKIIPAPPKHRARLGLQTSTQLGSAVLDTAKEVELCVPSTVSPP